MAKKNDFCGDRGNGDDSLDFPIEKARLRSVWVSLIVSVVAIAGYGWTLQAKTVCIAHSKLHYGYNGVDGFNLACGRSFGTTVHRRRNNNNDV